MPLPPLPGHRLRIVSEELPPPEERGFLYVRKLKVAARFAGEKDESKPTSYDCGHRSRMDAVVVVPHYQGSRGRIVVMRSALRPPVAARPREVWPVPEKDSLGELWEVPAGLVEEDERSPEGLRACAARELFEETGLEATAADLRELGPSTFPSPGVIGERHFFFHVEVDPTKRKTPPEDGSLLEHAAVIADVPLTEALAACRAGEVEDAKTELALRRLADIYGA
ncbi:MAG: NUDIX hydrolase [Polyangiaceae bacterium]|nr:NUDIX hydrolase [Polyangiaceae bacterium]